MGGRAGRAFPWLPLPLQRRGTDEYLPAQRSGPERRAVASVGARTGPTAKRLGMTPRAWCADRRGTAAALRSLNEAWGERFYEVVPEAEHDASAADAAFAGAGPVIDVQSHYVARERVGSPPTRAILDFIRSVAPERWKGLQGEVALLLSDYLRCLFLESETAVAVLTSAPGEGENNILTNAEIAGTRELLDRLSGSGRLLHHSIVHPNVPGELEAMEGLRDRFRPAGWKIYTLYPGALDGGRGWRLDDERCGIPFLERSRELGVRIVCAHKGLSRLAPAGTPEDVGPAAAAFPELDFLVYHSGFEVEVEEGPYDPQAPGGGVDRLLQGLAAAGVGRSGNVYAELGSTWFSLIRRPREAAHVLGKLLLALGEERILWGTDSVWYGSPQPLIDAFRAFRIPESFRERWGYPELTAAAKARILGGNAARVYGVDPARAARAAREDDLGWVRAALAHERGQGTPRI